MPSGVPLACAWLNHEPLRCSAGRLLISRLDELETDLGLPKMMSECERRKLPSTRTGTEAALIARPELALVAGHAMLNPNVRCLMR